MTARAKRFGALFCGGASKRMGRDKALLPWQGRPLLAHGIEVLQAAGAQVFLAVGSEARYGEFGLPCALDKSADLGPLGGLEAALDYALQQPMASEDDLLCVLACDMPHAGAKVFDALCERLGSADICLLRSSAGREPLFGVYRLAVLDQVRAALAAGRRKMDSFYGAYQICYLDTSELPGAAYASNMNTPEDYQDGNRS